jgi:hypothetical protein
MFVVDILFVLIIGVSLTALLGGGYRKRGGSGILLFFLILFVGTWGIGVWITPMGPALYGGYWLSFLLVGIVIALLMAAIPGYSEESQREMPVEDNGVTERKSVYAFNIFFWVLLVFLLVGIMAYYIQY